MVKKTTKRQRDIKSKLLAAICMLLVSSIMMVSSTYAWFTLSTAPEVTGITTSVGANGNLEMALLPANGSLNSITSGAGDGALATVLKNVTWGNLVDLSSDVYGLDQITLYPSALKETDGTIDTNFLSTPEYGADGRVSGLVNNAITSVYENGVFNASTSDKYGVRAVGISSGMTERQIAYRNAISAANSAASQAQRTASQSLNNNGAVLANLAVKHVDNPSATFTEAESKIPLLAITNALLGYDAVTGTDEDGGNITQHTTGAYEYIELALKQYIVANSIATATDEAYAALKTSIENATLADLAAGNVTDALLPTGFTGDTGYIALLADSKAEVASAKDDLEDLSGDAITWSEISGPVNKIADSQYMEIGGVKVSEINGYYQNEDGEYLDADGNVLADQEDESLRVSNKGRVMSAVASGGLVLELTSGAGAYADIADFCGDYSANVTVTIYGGNLDATMKTKTSQTTPYLTAAKNGTAQFGGNTTSTNTPVSDFYGYIIDLAFRTNAADSDLQLQVEATDRIYADGSNPQTMGHGSTMTFTSDSATFSGTSVAKLMQHLRIVFFDPTSREIISYARLNSAETQTGNDGSVTMNIMMTNEDGTAADSDVIMPLTQNTAHALSVLVYLDGETIQNADVATAAKSMTGSMNLQFSSSATLVPMDYTNLKTDNGDTPVAPTVTTLTNVSVTGDNTVTVGSAVYTDGDIVVELNGYTNQALTIKVGDAEAVSVTPTTAEGKTGINYAAEGVTADTAIVINATAAG